MCARVHVCQRWLMCDVNRSSCVCFLTACPQMTAVFLNIFQAQCENTRWHDSRARTDTHTYMRTPVEFKSNANGVSKMETLQWVSIKHQHTVVTKECWEFFFCFKQNCWVESGGRVCLFVAIRDELNTEPPTLWVYFGVNYQWKKEKVGEICILSNVLSWRVFVGSGNWTTTHLLKL